MKGRKLIRASMIAAAVVLASGCQTVTIEQFNAVKSAADSAASEAKAAQSAASGAGSVANSAKAAADAAQRTANEALACCKDTNSKLESMLSEKMRK
jgi:hypothetical protein